MIKLDGLQRRAELRLPPVPNDPASIVWPEVALYYATLGHPKPDDPARQEQKLRDLLLTYAPVVVDRTDFYDPEMPKTRQQSAPTTAEDLREWRWDSKDAWVAVGLLRVLGLLDLKPSIEASHLLFWRAKAAEIASPPRSMASLAVNSWEDSSMRRGPNVRDSASRHRLTRHLQSRINLRLRDVRLELAGDEPPFNFEHRPVTLREHLWLAIAELSKRAKTLVGACEWCGKPIVYGGERREGFRRGLIVTGTNPKSRARFCDNGGRCRQAAWRHSIEGRKANAERRRRRKEGKQNETPTA